MSDVTTVVVSHNRRDAVLRTMAAHRPPVILVDNASTDGTAGAVRAAFPHVRVVEAGRNAGAAARNVGVRLAGTPYVAFADDDSYWLGDSLAEAATLLSAYPRAALLAARVLVGEEQRLDPVSAYMGEAPIGWAPDLPGPSVLGFLACAVVVRREAFLVAGGFAERLHVYGEEALLAMDLAAAGWGLAYVPDLVVRHLPDGAGRDPAARARREARNRLLTTWLRRPLPLAGAAAWAALRDPAGRAGLAAALRHLPWVVRRRRRLPVDLECRFAAVEAGWSAFRDRNVGPPRRSTVGVPAR